MFYTSPPPHFHADMTASVIVCQRKGKILLMKRSADIPQGGKWAAAGGKLEKGEEPLEAAIRELFEETAIQLKNQDLQYCFTAYYVFPDIQYTLHFFKAELLGEIQIELNQREHSEYLWISPEEALSMDLMRGVAESLLKLYPQLKSSKNRSKASEM